MKFTAYFFDVRKRPDRSWIKLEWIELAISNPVQEQIQADGRVRRWAKIIDANDMYLRVIPLPDLETVHNAFFDRTFRP